MTHHLCCLKDIQLLDFKINYYGKRHTYKYAFASTPIDMVTHTHTRTRRPEVAVNSTSAFNPSWIVPPPGSSRSSGQLLSARGPSEPSISVRDRQECSVLFACFFVGVLSGGNPL